MQPIIDTYDLTRHFGESIAVNGLTLAIGVGEIFGFLGHNGAGKTTTIRLLNGILTPSAGTMRVLGLDPTTEGPAVRQRTGVLTETPALDERLTAADNLRFFAQMYGLSRSEVPARVKTLLATFDLADAAEQQVGGYSKGMKQRLALARALLHNPQVLFLDEPTDGLDPVAAHHVHRLIRQLSREQQHTVFLCTHNLVEAQSLCDRVAVLEHGRLLALGTPSELAHQYAPSAWLKIEVAPETLSLACDLLCKQPGITVHTAEEPQMLALQGVAHEHIPDLVALLAAGGVRLYRVAPQEPSLEDVYFALHHEKEEA